MGKRLAQTIHKERHSNDQWGHEKMKQQKKFGYFVSANGVRKKKVYLPLLRSFFQWGYIKILNHIIYEIYD